MKKANNLPNQKKYVCSFQNCQKTYHLKNILLAHLRTHYKIKPYICSYCSKTFNEKGNLKTHVRIHTGERPFKCKICSKSFKALGQLKDHFISHTGLKPFQCPFCKKFYRRKEILKNHFEIHKKDEYFLKNKEEYKEMAENINKMKNMILDFDNSNFVYKRLKDKVNINVHNVINSTGSGSETNLSCSVSSNDDSKQNFSNETDTNREAGKNEKIRTLKKEKENKEDNESEEKNCFEKNNKLKQENNFNKNSSNENINQGFTLPNNIIDLKFPSFPDIIFPYPFNLSLKEEQNNDLFNEEDKIIESNDFSFQKQSDNAEKEISVSINLNNIDNNNLYYSEDKKEKDFENYDCYSKITNLYFQTYQHKMDINNI